MIETANLRLVPHVPAHLLALIEEPARFERVSGTRAAAGLREFFVSGELSQDFLNGLRTLSGPDPWRLGFAIMHSEARLVIGSCGFKGPVDSSGMVEIAYGIVPAYQARGYATEAARALIDFALATEGVRVVRAHTLPTPNASTRVLTKCGFDFKGEAFEPDDGIVWRWELASTLV